MPVFTRLTLGLALIIAVLGLASLVVPDNGVLGRAPSTNQALAWASNAASAPPVLVSLAVGVVLLGLARRAPGAPERLKGAATLGPSVRGTPLSARLNATRAELTKRLGSLDGAAATELLVQSAVRLGASDIHLQPSSELVDVSVRIDGVLQSLTSVVLEQHKLVINRLKVLSNLTHFVSDKPQDGQFVLQTPDGKAEVRLSLLPTQFGEKAVLRLAGLANATPRFEDLALPQAVRKQLEHLLAKSQGLVFFTGPTGSGKTTSIYAALTHLKESRAGHAQIATIEDPIEFSLPGVAQTQVNRGAGLDFAAGLRAILRQDPNVMVVGEIRDVETARIATQAALTGHLLLTTVHADSSVGVFNRLLEMGVEPSVLSSVSLACFSQRLMRRLCPECRKPTPPSPEEAARLSQWGVVGTGYFTAPGCKACDGSGIKGRTAVFEVLVMNDAIRDALRGNPSSQQLMAVATSEGLIPLREAALTRARSGDVSLAEVMRVAG
jgi:general secretion pathway protein E